MLATELEFERLVRERLAREAKAEVRAKVGADRKTSEKERVEQADDDESPTSSDSEPSQETISTAQLESDTLPEQSDALTTANDTDGAQGDNPAEVNVDDEAPDEEYQSQKDIQQLKFAAERKATAALMAQRPRTTRPSQDVGANSLHVDVPVDPVNDLALDALVSNAAIQKQYEEGADKRNLSFETVQSTEPELADDLEEPKVPISIFRKILGLGRRAA